MTRAVLENLNGIIFTGSMICIFYAVFLGLKLKWFRARIKFNDSQTHKHSNELPVQGIGYKLKTNHEDFQTYKVISEFSSPSSGSSLNQQYPNTPPPAYESSEPLIVQRPLNRNKLPAINTNNHNLPGALTLSNTFTTTNTSTTTFKSGPEFQKTKKSIEFEFPKPTLKEEIKNNNILIDTDESSKSEIRDDSHKQNDIETNEFEFPKPAFKEEIKNNNRLIDINESSKSEIREDSQKQNDTEINENWKINILAEKKPRSKFLEMDDSYVLAEANSNSMYSSQAASIFVGATQPAVPLRTKFYEYNDSDESGSETCA